MEFELHSQLKRDCIEVGRFALCRLLLMNDKQFPWFILVPEVNDVTEIYQLSRPQQQLLIDESSYLAERLAVIFNADKINMAAIGNMVPQLHLHLVVRYRDDKAWPAPMWGKFPAEPYHAEDITNLLRMLRAAMAFLTVPFQSV